MKQSGTTARTRITGWTGGAMGGKTASHSSVLPVTGEMTTANIMVGKILKCSVPRQIF